MILFTWSFVSTEGVTDDVIECVDVHNSVVIPYRGYCSCKYRAVSTREGSRQRICVAVEYIDGDVDTHASLEK